MEHFGANTAYTPIRNRLYDSYPFGWSDPADIPDYPRCAVNPYASTQSIKDNINKMDTAPVDRTDMNSQYPISIGDWSPVNYMETFGESKSNMIPLYVIVFLIALLYIMTYFKAK